ncbi:MAG: hypothetical protein ACOCVB_02760, partial [Bacillota bacterium]
MKTNLKSLLTGIVVLAMVLSLGTASAFAYTAGRGGFDFGDVDFGGQTITILNDWNWEEGTFEELEEKFNCKIKVKTVGWWNKDDTAMTRLLAGDSDYDIWLLSQNHFFNIVGEGAFYPIGESIPEAYFENLLPDNKFRTETLSVKGIKYTLGDYRDPLGDFGYLAWNKTLFDEAGLVGLDELYLNDELTLDAVTEAAQALTQDFDNDGEMDQYGIGISYDRLFVQGNSGQYTKTEDGRVTFTGHEDPAVLEAWNYMQDWMTDLNVAIAGSWNN